MAQTKTVMLAIFIVLGVTGLMIIAAIWNAQALSKSREQWCFTFEFRGEKRTQCYPDFFICRENEAEATKHLSIVESCHKVS
jgi:hypothetical protein